MKRLTHKLFREFLRILYTCLSSIAWKSSSLMVTGRALNLDRSSSVGSSPGWGDCVVFLGKTVLSTQVHTNGYWQIKYLG